MFDTIDNYEVWDKPNHRFRQKLIEELLLAHQTIENVIREDLTLSESSRGVAISVLNTTISFMDGLLHFIDTVYRESIVSRYSKKKAWHLVTSLTCRIFSDIFEPRAGTLGTVCTTFPEQVATSILFSVLKILDLMVAFRDAKYKDHLSVSSEYVKFLSHNSPFEIFETLEEKFKIVEVELKNFKKDHQAGTKQLNTVTQKVDD